MSRPTVHHRKPRSLGGGDSRRNRTKLRSDKHKAWHLLFTNFQPHQIAEEINQKYLDPDYKFVVVRANE